MSNLNDLHPTFTRFAVEPYTPTIGAVVHDLDLGQPLDATTQAELRQALALHEVLFFRDQHITPQQQVDFTRSFGNVAEVKAFFPRLENHPEIEIVESTAERPKASSNWHADITWREQPPLGTSLYAQVIPASGGDTLWASLTAAYASLPPAFQAYLETLTAVHLGDQRLDRVPAAQGRERRRAEGRPRQVPAGGAPRGARAPRHGQEGAVCELHLHQPYQGPVARGERHLADPVVCPAPGA